MPLLFLPVLGELSVAKKLYAVLSEPIIVESVGHQHGFFCLGLIQVLSENSELGYYVLVRAAQKVSSKIYTHDLIRHR